jgi:hypothetical protein
MNDELTGDGMIIRTATANADMVVAAACDG